LGYLNKNLIIITKIQIAKAVFQEKTTEKLSHPRARHPTHTHPAVRRKSRPKIKINTKIFFNIFNTSLS